MTNNASLVADRAVRALLDEVYAAPSPGSGRGQRHAETSDVGIKHQSGGSSNSVSRS